MTSTETRAPEWDKCMGLTWSGKWHLIDTKKEYAGAYAKCGASIYLYDDRPKQYLKLRDIASGKKPAPVCKKCVPQNKAAQAEELARIIYLSDNSMIFNEALTAAYTIIEAGWVKRY